MLISVVPAAGSLAVVREGSSNRGHSPHHHHASNALVTPMPSSDTPTTTTHATVSEPIFPPPPPPSPSRDHTEPSDSPPAATSCSSSSDFELESNSSDDSMHTAPEPPPPPLPCSPFVSMQKRLKDIAVRNVMLLRRARLVHARMMAAHTTGPFSAASTSDGAEIPATLLPIPSPPPPSPESTTCTPLSTFPCAPAPEVVPESRLEEEVRELVARVLASVV